METKYDNTKIKELREGLGLTLEEFGKRLGKSRQHVQQWETGITKLSVSTIEQICTEYKVDPNYFFDLESPIEQVNHD